MIRLSRLAAVAAVCVAGVAVASFAPSSVYTQGYPGAAMPVPTPPYWAACDNYNGCIGGLWYTGNNADGNPVFENHNLPNNAAPAATVFVYWFPWYDHGVAAPTFEKDYLKVSIVNVFGVFDFIYDGPALSTWDAAAGKWTAANYPVTAVGAPGTSVLWRITPSLADAVDFASGGTWEVPTPPVFGELTVGFDD